jgi:DNA-directed RNA polymerase specialized sigma24 family protein
MTIVYDQAADTFDPEVLIEAAVRQRDWMTATTIALESYGLEIYRFIARQLGGSDTDEVFAQLAEDLLRRLPAFHGGTSVRNWMYTLVHDAWLRTFEPTRTRPLLAWPDFECWVLSTAASFRATRSAT